MLKLKFLFTAFITTIAFQAFAQLSAVDFNKEEYTLFKGSTTYYVLTGDEAFDTEMASVMKELWKITPTEAISDADFKKKIKEKTASFILPIIIGAKTHGYHYLALFTGGKKRIESYTYDDMLAYCPINFWGNEMALTTCSYRLRNMVESMILAMDLVKTNNIHGLPIKIVNDLQKVYNKKTKSIKDRTLLFCAETISKKLTETEIAKFYPYKFEIVDKERIAQVIKDKSKDYYYFQPTITMNKCMFIFDPSNGEVVYFDYQMSGTNITPSDVEEICREISGKKK
jgi:hypothetical protein